MTDTKKVIFGGIECDAAKASVLLLEITPMAIRVAESLAKDGCTKEKIAEGTAAAVDAVVRALVEVTVEKDERSEATNQEGRSGLLDPAVMAIVEMDRERIKKFAWLYREAPERAGESSAHDCKESDCHLSSRLSNGDFLVQVFCEQLPFALHLKPTEQK
ncbi:hypothetical protein [Serratia fonticola]|uniref:hypothetical protein n=1 Tax=Serratia fonticola TaxID=47917 RepID=UPI0016487CE6|nr:hypothetical protein [Serratia fonticola]MBC3230719.1 hypothetical protein [Serratia fonticola]